MTSHYPLLLQPTLHTRVWGGRKLADQLQKPLPSTDPYGESWELHGDCVVLNGDYAGQTLGDLVQTLGASLIGAHNDPQEGMPLLVKFLDAAAWLSIQVHPDDAFAAQLEGEPRGKTEAWVVLDAVPDAELVIGVQPDTPRDVIADAIAHNRLEDLLVYANVKAGDVLYIPAGTIHAIGAGILIYEIQQSSDTTYRLYDWGRLGLDGQPRPLHIEKSLTVANTATLPEIQHTAQRKGSTEIIVEGAYFRTLRHTLDATRVSLDTQGRVFHALSCIEGTVEIATKHTALTLITGQTALIPAGLGAYTLNGTGTVLNSMQITP